MPPDPVESAVVDYGARTQIAGLDRDVRTLQGSVVALDRKIEENHASMDRKIDAGFNQVFNRMDADRAQELQNATAGGRTWMWVIGIGLTTMLALVGVTFSFTTLITQPLRDADIRHQARLDKTQEDVSSHLVAALSTSEKIGALSSKHDSLEKLVKSLTDDLEQDQEQMEDRQMSMEGRLSELIGTINRVVDQLDAVDNEGSRKWNDRRDL